MDLVLIDFDGTITTKDSLADFIQFAVGKSNYYLGLFIFIPMLVAYKIKLIPNHIAKEKLITYFFKGWDADYFNKLADQYSLEKMDKIIRQKAIKRIRWHQQQGHLVVVISASMECWLKAWCDANNINLISTQLEIIDNKLSGKFATKNCYGLEKASRVKEVYDLSQYDHVYAYGDSRGDKELMALADEVFYKPFRD